VRGEQIGPVAGDKRHASRRRDREQARDQRAGAPDHDEHDQPYDGDRQPAARERQQQRQRQHGQGGRG